MGNVKNVVSVVMAVVLLVLCLIAITSDLLITLKIFTIFAAVCGFFELHKWHKNK